MKPFLITEAKKERYVQQGYWGLPTLVEVFEKNAALYPDKEFVVDSRTRLTFADAKKYTDRIALGLAELGYQKDDVLVAQLPNIAEAPLVRLAMPKAGVLPLLVLSAFNAKEMQHILDKTASKGVVIVPKVGDTDYLQMIQEMRSELPNLQHIFVAGDEVPAGCISLTQMMQRPIETEKSIDSLKDREITTWEVQELQTSTGSTGLPKISEAFGWNQLLGAAHQGILKLTDKDVLGLPIPFPGGIANNAWCPSVHVPCKLALMEKFSPLEALKFIEREKVSVFYGVPAIGEMLVRVESLPQFDVSSLRIFFTAGAPMPPSLAKDIEEKLGCKVLGLLGSMDFGPISVASIEDSETARRTAVGKAFPGNELRIVREEDGQDAEPGQPGELLCRGPYAFTGYYKMPDMTLEMYAGDMDGWFRTGDLAKIDQDGYLYITGRLKDVIKRGAMTIAPVEIEDLLRRHPKVKEVAVGGMPDAILGEKVCAFVIPEPGAQLTFDEMVEFLKEMKLTTFKLPERLEIMSEFPTVGGQKISKKALTEMVTAKLQAEGKI